MNSAHPRYLFIDIAGTTLTPEDRDILAHPAIAGIILFSRNYASPDQLCALTCDIKKISSTLHITVDQEGGRVQRFRTGFTELPSMGYWGERYTADPIATKEEFTAMLKIMVDELRQSGVDSTLVPVLDIDYGHNAVIGHRAFGSTVSLVTEIGALMIDVFHSNNFPVTDKHFPGHGFVSHDSHLELPIDKRSFADIAASDLQPFQTLSSKLDAIMLAHVVYEAVDPNPVCFSRFWIQEVLRKQLQFRGRVMSDDLSMQAVAAMGGYPERVARALEAGCDLLLVCNAREGVISILDSAV